MRTVCFVGAGAISHVHAEVVRAIPSLCLHSVVDTDTAVAQALARRWRIGRVFVSAEEAIGSGEVGCVHVLTPPDRHATAALPFLKAGIPVLLEKPLAATVPECFALQKAAADNDTILGVNQNYVHHPAFVRLRQAVVARRIGPPRVVTCVCNIPLRQMTTRAFGHWMFAEPGNILLEQAVHPLSQIVALAGRIEDIQVTAGVPVEISPGVPFYPVVSLNLRCARIPATLYIAVGQSFPFWQVTAVCDDGVAIADIINNRFITYERTALPDFIDSFLSAGATAGALMRGGTRNAADYLLSTARIKGRSDGFYRSIKGCVGAFHEALDAGQRPELDGDFGTHLVEVCVHAATTAFATRRGTVATKVGNNQAYEVLVLGGTGFIGTHVIRRLLAEGLRVGVMARNVHNLGPDFFHERLTVIAGDVRCPEDVGQCIGKARLVINLAHGGGRTFEEVRAAMVGSAEIVAQACLDHGVERLIHVGSIASLYLGPQRQVITGATPPDPQHKRRGDYAQAKAECDRMLQNMHRDRGLPVCLLRPGVVVGEGGIANHSALGVFNNDQHCIGWNQGRNPLPFVLVEDVADAVWRVCQAPGVVGRCYNLVGDVRLSARDYLAELSKVLERPLHFHPKNPTHLWFEEMAKWLIKVAIGRKAPLPSRYDILSRGLVATFNCDDVGRDLGWRPIADRKHFIERGIHQKRLETPNGSRRGGLGPGP